MWNQIRKVKLKDILAMFGFRSVVEYIQVNEMIKYKLPLCCATASSLRLKRKTDLDIAINSS